MTLQNAFENLAVESKQDDEITYLGQIALATNSSDVSLGDIDSKVLTDAQLRATPVPVTGTFTTSGEVEVKNDIGNPIPVNGTVAVSNPGLTDAQLRATPVPVSGTVTSNIGTTNGLALDATLTGGTQKAIARGGAKGTTTAADVTSTSAGANHNALDVAVLDATGAQISPLTDTQLRATAVPVSGPLTDTQLRATPVPVSGTVTANIGTTNGLALDATLTGGTQKAINRGGAKGATTAADVTSTAAGANHQGLDVVVLDATGNQVSPLTDTQLRATAVPVSGPLTDTQLRATAVPVSGPLTDAQLRATAVPVSGTVTANVGTTNGLALDATLTGGTQKAIARGGAKGSTTAADVTSTASGANHNALDVINYDAAGNVVTPLTDTQLRATPVPVSGTVTANIGTTNGLALDATLTGGTQRTKITDGTTNAAVKAASTAAVATDPALVVAISPNNPITLSGEVEIKNDTGNPVPVNGTVTVGNASLAVTGPLTDTQLRATAVPISAASLPLPTGAATAAKQPALGTAGTPSADVISIQGEAGMTAVKTDGSAVTQPVSGTVTANLGTVAGLALDATLTGGTQKAIARGGAKGSTAAADVTSTASGANHQALDVINYDAAGNVVSGLTDTQLRATPVPVSGTITAAEQKLEDSAAANGDPGIPALAVRNDTAAVKTSADGDYSNLSVDSAGRMGISTLGATLSVSDAALATSNTALGNILTQVTAVNANTDTIETLIAATNSKLDDVLAAANANVARSIYRNLGATTGGSVVKGSAGRLYSINVYNTNALAARFLKVYNKATAASSADTPVMTIVIAAGGSQTFRLEDGVPFAAGIGIRGTGAFADADVTVPGTNDIIVDMIYT